MDALTIALIGFGNIAQTRHVPVIAARSDFRLVAITSDGPVEAPAGIRVHRDHRALLADPSIDAVAICTPPAVRAALAADALAAGKHVLLEKPPASTLGEVEQLRDLALASGKTLFAAWHSHFNLAVEEARRALQHRRIVRLDATWHEDVERWHPGQDSIWEPKGLGVFDAGVNAVSILTRILPQRQIVHSADFVMSPGRAAPIAARVELSAGSLDLDWRVKQDRREIVVDCEDGTSLALTSSGRHLSIDGIPAVTEDNLEYPALYTRFRELIAGGSSDIDTEPLQLIADAFLVARRSAG